jgi:hypothetical protein
LNAADLSKAVGADQNHGAAPLVAVGSVAAIASVPVVAQVAGGVESPVSPPAFCLLYSVFRL